MPDSPLSPPRPPPPRVLTSAPVPEAPLAGLTLLAVEDSRIACDALRLMAQRSGARLRRADTLQAAGRHLRTYRPDVVLLDPGLPDGDGLTLVAALARRGDMAPPVLVISGQPELCGAALASGAAGFLAKPVADLAAFRRAVLACLPDRAWLAVAACLDGAGAERAPAPAPDPLSLRDDLAAAARRLAAGPDEREGRYLAGFLAGLARATGDADLAAAADAARRARPGTGPEAMRHLAGAVAARLPAVAGPRVLLGEAGP